MEGATERLADAARLGRLAAQTPEALTKQADSQRRHSSARSSWDESSQPVRQRTWPKPAFFALIQPDGDILPARTIYGDGHSGNQTNIGLNPLTSGNPIWFAGPDIVVCHMNPLIQNSVDGVGLRFNHWENLVKEKIGEVRKLEAKPSGTAVAAVVAPVQPVIAVAPASQAEQSE